MMNFSELVFSTQGYLELDGNTFWYEAPGIVVRKPLSFFPL